MTSMSMIILRFHKSYNEKLSDILVIAIILGRVRPLYDNLGNFPKLVALVLAYKNNLIRPN